MNTTISNKQTSAKNNNAQNVTSNIAQNKVQNNAHTIAPNNNAQSVVPVMNFVAYYRVSTQKQGISGLGLEAQSIGVNAYINNIGGVLQNEYTEVISGSLNSNKRLQFQKAVNECVKTGAILVVFKLDRLGRSLPNFINDIIENKKVGYIAIADKNMLINTKNISADAKFLLQLEIALGERERAVCIERTANALKARKERGIITVNQNIITKEARLLGAIAMHETAKENENNINAYGMVCTLYKNGIEKFNEIAKILTEAKIKKPTGIIAKWCFLDVQRLFKLYSKTEKRFNIFEVSENPTNELETILHIKDCIENKKMKYNQIAKRLNAIAYKDKTSKKWYAQTVKRAYLKTIINETANETINENAKECLCVGCR